MYAYLPKEYLILGLKSKEIAFSSLEENMRLDLDVITAALDLSSENVEHVPVDFWDESKQELLDKVQSTYSFSGPLNLELHIRLAHLRDKLFDKDYFFKMAFDVLISNCDEYRIFDALHMLREELEHPFFTSPEYLAEFLSYVEDFLTSSNTHSSLSAYRNLGVWVFAHIEDLKKNNLELARSFLSNFKVLNYFLLTEFGFGTPFEEAFPEEMLQDKQKMINFFDSLDNAVVYPWSLVSDRFKTFQVIFENVEEKYIDCYLKSLVISSKKEKYVYMYDVPSSVLLSAEKLEKFLLDCKKSNVVCIFSYDDNKEEELLIQILKTKGLDKIAVNYIEGALNYLSCQIRFDFFGENTNEEKRIDFFINVLKKVDVDVMPAAVLASIPPSIVSFIESFGLLKEESEKEGFLVELIMPRDRNDSEEIKKNLKRVISAVIVLHPFSVEN